MEHHNFDDLIHCCYEDWRGETESSSEIARGLSLPSLECDLRTH
jgi:hypothetical protein